MTQTQTPTARFVPGDRVVVTTDITCWVGLVPAGTVVTIVDLDEGLDEGEDYAAELADGCAVSFTAAELAPITPGFARTAALPFPTAHQDADPIDLQDEARGDMTPGAGYDFPAHTTVESCAHPECRGARATHCLYAG